ncbi:MAG: ribonuclease P protein component [Acidobacteria bacterium]|nr:MAG: ribonuclease P protein component [Acidobacteriota bacterium]REJ99604.1 MAG: ribonuclease P protein component [Acidobacteriota bacterium]
MRRSQRLGSSSSFARCYREGRRVRDRDTAVFFLAGPAEHGEHGGELRLGVTVSRRLGKSVRRHLLKRWVREIFRRSHWRSQIPAGDLVVHLYPGAADFEFHEMERSLGRHLERLADRRRGGPR